MDGILKAKQKGVKFRVAKKLTDEQMVEMTRSRSKTVLKKTFMKDYKLLKVSIYRYLETNFESNSDSIRIYLKGLTEFKKHHTNNFLRNAKLSIKLPDKLFHRIDL